MPTQLTVGDEVTNGRGGLGVVELSRPRRSDGQRFPIVRITSGPRAGAQEWPREGGWRAVLDWDATGAAFRCTDCERTYRAQHPRGYCVQCYRQNVREPEARIEARPTTSRGIALVGSRRVPRYSQATYDAMNARAAVALEEMRALPPAPDDDDCPF